MGVRYARKCLRRPALLFVLDSFTVIPSAALVFTCSPDGCWLGHHVQGLEIFLAAVFFLEMMLKMYAFGLRGPHAYFRAPQTCFDTIPIIVKARGPIAMLIFSVFCFAALAMQIPGHLDEGSLARASTSENFSTFPRAFAFSWGVIFGDGILPMIYFWQTRDRKNRSAAE